MKKYVVLFFLFSCVLSASELHIIFTANVNGILEDCRCGNEPLGGLARVKTFVTEFRQQHPNTLLIDGGDFLNPYTYPDLNNAMSDFMQYLDYDIITAGDQEFIEGYDFFQKHLQRYQKIFLASNCNFGRSIIQRTVNDIPVTVVSFLSPKCFTFIRKPKQLVIDSLLTGISGMPGKGLRILLYHGETKDIVKRLPQISCIDLVLSGHVQRLDSWQENGICFVGGGLDTEVIMIVKATGVSGNWEFEVTSREMDASVMEDHDLKSLIGEYKSGRKGN